MFVLRAREGERRGREGSLLPCSGGGRRRFLLSYDLAEERKGGGGRAKSLQSNLLKEGRGITKKVKWNVVKMNVSKKRAFSYRLFYQKYQR